MNKSVLHSSSTNAPEYFDRQDWASAYCNVEEELNDYVLELVSGSLPEQLSGTLYKNGPGRLERSGQWVHHPFDGDGMITAVKIKNGKITFSNRFVQTEAWKEEEKAGKFIYRGVFGTQKSGGPLANAFDLRLKNIANTHVVQLGNELLALWEAAGPHALNPNNLETFGLSNLGGVLQPGEAFSAHPRFDPGHHGHHRMVTFGVKTGPQSTIRLMEFDNNGTSPSKLISDRKDIFKGFAFLHDFAITPNWAIFLQNAISFNPIPFLIGQKGAAQCLRSKQGDKGKFLLIPRDCGAYAGQSPLTFDAPQGFVFHHLNAWEKNQNIIIESIYYKDFPSIAPHEDFRQINFDQIPEGQLKSCSINIPDKEIEVVQISPQCCEFAMVNPRNQGLQSHYCWMAVAEQKTGNAPLQAIKKVNLSNRDECFWSAAPRGFVSEPIMIPNPASKLEDEGWIIVLVWNSQRKATDLVILEASDLSERALVHLPIAIPYGLHGSWVSSKDHH